MVYFICQSNSFYTEPAQGGVVFTLDGCSAYWAEFNRLEKRADGNLIKFSKEGGRGQYLGGNNSMHQYMLGTDFGKQLFREISRGFDAHQVACDPAMHSCGNKDSSIQHCIRQCSQQVSGGILPLLCIGEAHLVWG